MLRSPLAPAAGVILVALLVGIAIGGIGSASPVALVGISGAVFVAFATIFILVYDLPITILARIGLIASFFIKLDFAALKIDEIEDPSGFNVSLTFICAVVLFIHDLYAGDRERGRRVFPLYFSAAVAGLTVCAAISAFYGVSGKLAWFGFASFMMSVFIAFVIASHFGTRERLRELVIGIALGIGFTGAVAVAQFFTGQPKLPFLGTGTEEELLWTQAEVFSRVSAFLRTPTEMGWVVSAMIPLLIAPVIARAREFNFIERAILSLAALAGVAAIILSLARGSWLALIAGTAIVVMLGWMNWDRSERRGYFASIAGLALLASLALAPFGGRIYERLTADDGDSAMIRIPLMQVAWNIIEDNPLVGVGPSGYRTAMYRYDDTKEHVTQVFPGTVHNSFAHITAEIGIPGGVIFMIILLIAVVECLRTMTSTDRLLFALGLAGFAALIAFGISAIKEPGGIGSVRPPIRTLFLLLGFIMAIRCAGNAAADAGSANARS